MGTQGAGNSGGPGAERREAPPALGLPCLFETTASEEDERPPLPGPRKKQAEALTQNIQWMAETFGKERIGFLTLTLGDFVTGGRYRNLRERKEAPRGVIMGSNYSFVRFAIGSLCSGKFQCSVFG